MNTCRKESEKSKSSPVDEQHGYAYAGFRVSVPLANER